MKSKISIITMHHQLHIWLITVFGISLVFLSGCGYLGGVSPFYIPKEAFEAKVKTLAFSGVYVIYEEQDKTTTSKIVSITETQIVDLFNQSGKYKVIPPSVTHPLEEEIMQQLGFKSYFIFNPKDKSSTLDMDRMYIVIKELKKRLNADAILRVEYITKLAEMENDKVEWDGVKETYVEKGTFGKAFGTIFGTPTKWSGSMPVASLKASIIDEEQILWQDYGGVGLTVKRIKGQDTELTAVETYFEGKPENTKRINRAIKIAFKSLGLKLRESPIEKPSNDYDEY